MVAGLVLRRGTEPSRGGAQVSLAGCWFCFCFFQPMQRPGTARGRFSDARGFPLCPKANAGGESTCLRRLLCWLEL